MDEAVTAVEATRSIKGKEVATHIHAAGVVNLGIHTVHRFKRKQNSLLDADYETDFARFTDWIEEYKSENPDAVANVEVDASNQFTRAFISFPDVIEGLLISRLGSSSLDGTAFKHAIYNGQLVGHIARCGNNKLALTAVAVVAVENASNYQYFGDKCKEAGLSGILTSEDCIIADRDKGMPFFLDLFDAVKVNCGKHLVWNVRDHCRRTPGANSRGPWHDNQFWDAQGSDDDKDLEKNLSKLEQCNQVAADYLRRLLPELWCTYALNKLGLKLWNHRTSGISEACNAVWLEARLYSPLRCLEQICLIAMRTQRERAEVARGLVERAELLTPYAMKMLIDRSAEIGRYGVLVEMSDQEVGYCYRAVEPTLRTKVVMKLGAVSCTKSNGNPCKDFGDTGVPCRHIIACAQGIGLTDNPAKCA